MTALTNYKGDRPSPQMPLASSSFYECIVILLPDEHLDYLLEKIEAWFNDRDEIILVAHGQMSKGDNSYISLEWEGVKADPLFIAIIQDEDRVTDYAYYEREG